MNFNITLGDDAILGEIGDRLARKRLDRNLSQADLAEAAGVSPRTIRNIEAKGNGSLQSLVRILRALDALDAIEQVLPPPMASPMAELRLRGKERKRSSKSRSGEEKDDSWRWGDER